MRRYGTAYLLAVLLSGTIVAAQDAKRADTKVKADNGKVVTMTGCVEIGGGTSFVLTNDKSYSLVARKGLDLGPYIQQKVELTGVVVPAATSRDGDDKIKITEPAAPSSTTVKVARGKDAQFLVASVKTLAPTCQP